MCNQKDDHPSQRWSQFITGEKWELCFWPLKIVAHSSMTHKTREPRERKYNWKKVHATSSDCSTGGQKKEKPICPHEKVRSSSPPRQLHSFDIFTLRRNKLQTVDCLSELLPIYFPVTCRSSLSGLMEIAQCSWHLYFAFKLFQLYSRRHQTRRFAFAFRL